MSKTEEIASFTDTDNRYVAYQTSYNNDLFNIVDQHKNKTIAENLVFEQAKNIVDELESAAATLQELKERVEDLKKKPLEKQKEGAKRLNIRINREATEKLEALNNVISIIEELQYE